MTSDNQTLLAVGNALNLYAREIEDQRSLCSKHVATSAVHDAGKELQIYRQFDRKEEIAASIRRFGDMLPDWEETFEWSTEKNYLLKIQREIVTRMKRHTKQHEFYTRGVSWENRPLLIHAYKFEPDPVMKLEIIVPNVKKHIPELPLNVVCCALRLHDYLVPSFVAKAKPPYASHDVNFLTLTEYLTREMPKGLCATGCIPFIKIDSS